LRIAYRVFLTRNTQYATPTTLVTRKMTQNFWRELVSTSLQTEEDELGCGECKDTLDQYVDLLDAGQDPALILPRLAQHLEVCHCCFTEMEALLIAIEAAVPPKD